MDGNNRPDPGFELFSIKDVIITLLIVAFLGWAVAYPSEDASTQEDSKVTKAEDLSEEEMTEIKKDNDEINERNKQDEALGNPDDTEDEYAQKTDERVAAIKDEMDSTGDNDPEIEGYPFQVRCTDGYANGYKTFNEAETAASEDVAEGVTCNIN